MAYIQDEYHFSDSIENEIKYQGLHGAKGEHRGERKKSTPEAIKRQNQWNRLKNLRRLIKNNFVKGDYFCTFLYSQGTRKSLKEIQEDVSKYHRKLRKEYKSRGYPYKWVSRVEIGRNGGTHLHMLVGQLHDERMDLVMQDTWHEMTGGRINFEPFKGADEDSESVASYMVKPLTDAHIKKCEELGLNPSDYVRVSHSRNLAQPKHIRKQYSHWTMRRIIEEQMPRARAGYMVVKDSVRFCSNIYTGMTHCYYTEVKGGSP